MPNPQPFWHDDDWVRRMKQPLSPAQRDAFDDAFHKEHQPIFRLRQGSPEWIAAEAAARERLEAKFSPSLGSLRS